MSLRCGSDELYIYCVHVRTCVGFVVAMCFFFQAEDGIRDLVRSRGLGDVYKRQLPERESVRAIVGRRGIRSGPSRSHGVRRACGVYTCLLYTSDAADERSSVDLGGRRIIKKKTKDRHGGGR